MSIYWANKLIWEVFTCNEHPLRQKCPVTRRCSCQPIHPVWLAICSFQGVSLNFMPLLLLLVQDLLFLSFPVSFSVARGIVESHILHSIYIGLDESICVKRNLVSNMRCVASCAHLRGKKNSTAYFINQVRQLNNCQESFL